MHKSLEAGAGGPLDVGGVVPGGRGDVGLQGERRADEPYGREALAVLHDTQVHPAVDVRLFLLEEGERLRQGVVGVAGGVAADQLVQVVVVEREGQRARVVVEEVGAVPDRQVIIFGCHK